MSIVAACMNAVHGGYISSCFDFSKQQFFETINMHVHNTFTVTTDNPNGKKVLLEIIRSHYVGHFFCLLIRSVF